MIRRAGFGLVAGALALAIMSAPPAQAANEWEQRGADLTGSSGSEFGYSVDVSADGNTWIAGAPWADPSGTFNAGTARVFTWNGESWEKRGSTIEGDNSRDYLGAAVAISDDGNTIAVGAPNTVDDKDTAGYVRVFDWNAGTSSWQERGNDIEGEALGDEFGSAVALSSDGSVVAVGAPYNNGGGGGKGAGTGHVRVFEWVGNLWTQLGADIDGGADDDKFGTSVALSSDGRTVAGGAPENDNPGVESGNARVYSLVGGNWVKNGQSISGEASGDASGRSVALSGDGQRIAIGAPNNDGGGSFSGQARVYEFDTDSDLWVQLGDDIDGSAAGDRLGSAVDLSNDGNTLLVGARNADQAGAVEVFSWNGTSWIQLGQTVNGNEAGEEFGFSVAISSVGDKFVVGGNYANVPAFKSGVVRAYTWIPASGEIPGPRTEFTYWLPDGRECTSISPQRVQVGTMVRLPDETALCQTSDGSLVAGWVIPMQPGSTGYGSASEPFPPGLPVRVLDSQRFTLVPFEPVLTIEYDANIGIGGSCNPADVDHVSDDGQLGYSWVPRADFAVARAWDQAPCTPEDHELVGWNTAGDGSGESIEVGASLPGGWETSRVNERRLFAMWQAL